jgi:hypothetical protein
VLGFSNGEELAVFVPCCGNQIVELANVGSGDDDFEFVGIMDEA